MALVEEEAEAVRAVFRYLVDLPLAPVAAALEHDGVPYRPGRRWTKDAVRDIWRRRRMYLGWPSASGASRSDPGRIWPS